MKKNENILFCREINNQKDILNLNYNPKTKKFFIEEINKVIHLLSNYKIFCVENENKEVKGLFVINFIEPHTIQIAFYVIDPLLDNLQVLNIIENFLDFLENFAKKNNITKIIAGVDYYNDELFEKMVEKGFVAISYRMVKEIKD